jgi:uncharacterized protein YcfJ
MSIRTKPRIAALYHRLPVRDGVASFVGTAVGGVVGTVVGKTVGTVVAFDASVFGNDWLLDVLFAEPDTMAG